MHTTKPLTPPATGGVFRSPPLARAHVDCTDVQSVVRRDYLHNLLSLDHARARTPAKRGAAIQKPDAYYRKLRLAKFGGDFNPIEAAVDEAVAAFAGAASRGSRPLALLALLGRPLTRANLGRSRRARANLENLEKRITAPCGCLRPIGKQASRAKRVPSTFAARSRSASTASGLGQLELPSIAALHSALPPTPANRGDDCRCWSARRGGASCQPSLRSSESRLKRRCRLLRQERSRVRCPRLKRLFG